MGRAMIPSDLIERASAVRIEDENGAARDQARRRRRSVRPVPSLRRPRSVRPQHPETSFSDAVSAARRATLSLWFGFLTAAASAKRSSI